MQGEFANVPNRIKTTLAATLVGAMVSGAGGCAQAQDLQEVKIGVATTFLGITYPWLMMPQALGYWQEEGYDVQVLPIGGSLQVVQQMVGGGVDVGEINASVVIQSRSTNDIPVRLFMTNSSVDWSVGVPADSSIQGVGDLKGKKIGVFNLASGGIPLLKSYLETNGIDPEADVTLIPLGFGAPVVQAIKNGDVDAVMYWASANAGFENAGLSMRYLFDPVWRAYPGFSLTALDDADPEMLEAIARGAAKATVFSIANPDCVRQLQWKHWPDTKPQGTDEETAAKWDLNSLQAQLDSMQDALDSNDSGLWGEPKAEAFEGLQSFLLDAGLVEKALPVSDLMIQDPDFFKRVNDFDSAPIIEAAKACKID